FCAFVLFLFFLFKILRLVTFTIIQKYSPRTTDDVLFSQGYKIQPIPAPGGPQRVKGIAGGGQQRPEPDD
ncbi:hypothetical protein, partial [Pseudomonas savastanoi]|uniref:hypothetical protein n=1 Tax=Pseudomonas savastanoi TaxID=29438 RepID=UPI001CC1FBB0